MAEVQGLDGSSARFQMTIQLSSQKRKRSTYRRSRYGCLTCRVRRIRCDETQPICMSCSRTGRKCEGAAKEKLVFLPVTTSLPNSSTYLQRPQPQIPLFPHCSNTQESESFNFFLQYATHTIAVDFDSDFWRFLIPSTCQSNLVIWYAALAMGGLLQHSLQDQEVLPQVSNCSLHARSLKWYNKALSAFRHQHHQTDSTSLALLSCILFLSIEYQQGNAANASTLLLQGLNILAHNDKELESSHSTRLTKSVAFTIYVRQWAHLMNHGLRGPAHLDVTMLRLRQKEAMAEACPTSVARARIFQLLQDSEKVIRESWLGPEPLPEVENQRLQILRDLDIWLQDFDTPLREAAIASPQNVYLVCSLRMCYGVCKIWVSACIGRAQTFFDDHFEAFDEIVRHGECAIEGMSRARVGHAKPIYLFDMGIIPSLFFGGWKCRHPIIRRRAVELLRRGPRQEGLFSARKCIIALEMIIEIEERNISRNDIHLKYDGSQPYGTSEQEIVLPNEESRMQHAVIHWETLDGQKSPLTLIYWLASDPDTPIRVTYEPSSGDVKFGVLSTVLGPMETG